MANPLKIQQLRQFVVAASRQSFRAAALESHRSQAAITLAMQNLEQEIGGQLFEQGHQARLTPLGEAVLPLLTEMVAVHDRVQNEIRLLASGEHGSVGLAVMPSLAEEWLPILLREFAQRHAGVRLRVADVSSPQVGPMVESGEAELGVAGLIGNESKLICDEVARDTFGVVCLKEHWIAQRGKSVPWKALNGEILIENTTFHALQGKGLPAKLDNPGMIMKNRTSLVAAVKAGLGITVLPTLAQPAHEHGLAFVPLVSPKVTRVVGIVRRAGHVLSPAAVHMHELMRTSLMEFARRRGADVVGDRTSFIDRAKERK
jgi:DNA-binding transcriptional LysR family regulator